MSFALLVSLASAALTGDLVPVEIHVVGPGGATPPGPAYVVLRNPKSNEVVFEAVVPAAGTIGAHLPPGSYELSCAAPGFTPRGFGDTPMAVEVTAAKAGAFSCPVGAAVKVSGTVVAEAFGKPLAGARVYYAGLARDPRLTPQGRAFLLEKLGAISDENGKFSLFLPAKSRVSLAAEGEGTARVVWNVTVPPDGGDLGRLSLPPGGGLSVRMPEEAAALGSLRFSLRPLWSLWTQSAQSGAQAVAEVALEAGREVVWDKLPVGWYLAQVGLGTTAGDYLWRSAVEIAPKDNVSLAVPLAPWTLRGRVAGVDEALWPCRVVATGYGGLWEATTVAKEPAVFSLRLRRQEPVRLSLECQQRQFLHVFDEALVAPGSRKSELELRLPQGKFAITVKDRQGRAAPHVRVAVASRATWIAGPGGTVCEGTTDSQGVFSCPGIAAEKAMVLVQGAEGFFGPAEVSRNVTVELRPGRDVSVVVNQETEEPAEGKTATGHGESFYMASFTCFDAPGLLVASTRIATSGVAVLSDVPRCAGFLTVISNNPHVALGFATVPEGADATVSVRLAAAGVAVLPGGISQRLAATCNPGRYVWNWGRAGRFPLPEGFSFFTNFPPAPEQPLVVWRAPVGQPLTLEAVDWDGRVCAQWAVPSPLPPQETFMPVPPLVLPEAEGKRP